MKRFVCVLLVALMCLTLLGVSQADTGKAKITFLGLTTEEAKLNEMRADFNAVYPDIEMQFELYPYPQMIEVLEVKLGSGDDSLDVIYTNCPEIPGYVNRGYLAPLDEYFTEQELETWVEKSRKWGTVDGKFYSPPLNSSSQLLYYNKALLDEAGVAYPSEKPEDRLSWEQLAELAQQVQQKLNPDGTTGVWGMAFQQVDVPYQILALPNSLGGVGVKGEGGLEVLGVVNDDAWTKAMTYYYDLANTWNVMPKGTSDTNSLFMSGKLAFLVGGPWTLSTFHDVEDLEWGYAAHPCFEGAEIAIPTDSWHLAVSAYSKNPEAAAKYVHWATTEESGIRSAFKNVGNLPCAKFMLQEIIDNVDGSYTDFPMNGFSLCAYDELNYSFSRPNTIGFREWDYAMTEAFQDIRNGADPKGALDAAAETIDAAFNKYR